MNKLLIIFIGVLVLGLGFVLFSSEQRQTTTSTEEKDSLMEKTDDSKMTDKNGVSRYAEYSKTAFDQSSDKRRVLYFYASWCPTCRPADTNFKENAGRIPEDVLLLRVNYNDPETDQEEKDLAKKYGITYQHTFVQIDSQNKEIAKWNGGQIEELLAKLK